MERSKIRVGITHGDINGVGYEVILKTFANSGMLELCTPIVYGSPKIAAYHRKSLNLSTNFTIINSASEAHASKLNVLSCVEETAKVEFATPSKEAGKVALQALDKAVEDYKAGLIDVIVTAPINKHTIHSDEFNFPGHTEYIEEKLGRGRKSLMILMKDDLRVALVTGHLPLGEVASSINQELIQEKISILGRALNYDFGIKKPRIAVLSLNPHSSDDGLLGKEEEEIITPAINEMNQQGMFVYGPYPADGFFGSNQYVHFDGILAMYHDQGLAPFKALAMDRGVNFTAGLPVIRTSPAHGTAYDIAGKGEACEGSFREAIYAAIDIYKHRKEERQIHNNPLRKQYFDKKDDSDKLDLETEEEI